MRTSNILADDGGSVAVARATDGKEATLCLESHVREAISVRVLGVFSLQLLLRDPVSV